MLPFKLPKYHRNYTKNNWTKYGLKFENDLAFHLVYKKYINAKQCELCQEVFTKSRDRQMDHCHTTGEFRNIVCQKCNKLKADREIPRHNTSGYKGISWHKRDNVWCFRARIDGKEKQIKQMKDLHDLVKFADSWKLENNYHT